METGLCTFVHVITLGIETSCDETSCGLVDGNLKVLANQIHSQALVHAEYGGVVPEIAARAHLEKIDPVARATFAEAGLSPSDVGLIAYTRGPGLLGPLLVGASFARALARSVNRPIVGVNHLEGHLGSAFLEDPDLKPPFLCLVVSGGHTEFVLVGENLQYTLIGKTRDDAAGEAFDKCGKILGLGYPAGPVVAKTAAHGNRDFLALPRALDRRDNFEFSFSGLKTAVLRYAQGQTPAALEQNLAHICASLESAIVEVLVKKAVSAVTHVQTDTLAVVGGVSANSHLRERMREEAKKRGFRALFPSVAYCGDNGAMIAAIAQVKHRFGIPASEPDVKPSLRWS
jgi:N6-L-threonylcarbamoyladenine synthase